MNWKRKLIVIALIILVVLAVIYGFIPRPVSVDTEVVTKGDMMVTVVEEGKTRVVDRFDISAPVPGYARRIEFKVGDAVKRGQEVAELEPLRSGMLDPRSRAASQARLEAAESSLESAREEASASRAESELAKTEFERVAELYERRFASKDEFDRAKASLDNAAARLRSAEFSVDVAKYQVEEARTALRFSTAENGSKGLGKVSVRSPVNGSVLQVHHKSEGVVDAAQPLMTVGNPNALEVEVDVLSDDAVRIKPGMRVLLERWGGDEPLEARVRTIEPSGFTKVSSLGVEEQRVLVISDFTSSPQLWERLGDGYRVEAKFIIWEGSDILQVPESALFRHEKGWSAFVIKDGKARRRPMEVGHRGGLVAEVISGLNEGDMVITHPDDSIEDGTRVRPRKK